MTKRLPDFEDTLSKLSRGAGFAYLPFHVFILPVALGILAAYLPGGLSDVSANIIYYALGFVVCLGFMWGYLRSAFDKLLDNPALNIAAVISSCVVYIFLNLLTSLALLLVLGDAASNPNNEMMNRMSTENPRAMLGLAVLIGPIVEEVLFRGVVFGSLRGKSRVAAYAVSMLLFAFYHVWQYALVAMDWRVLLYAVSYIPAGYTLAWLYEKTSCIWIPIFVHMLINAASMLVLNL